MSQWQIGDGFSTVSPQSHGEIMQSWNQENNNTRSAQAEAWSEQQNVKASSFHYDASQVAQYWRHSTTTHTANEAPLSLRIEPKREEEAPLATRVELGNNERAESNYLRNEAKDAPLAGKDNVSNTPLSRIYDILDVHSASSRWLEQRGYLEAFKSPNCTLDLTFGTEGNKVGAVMTAPDGSKRTVVACEGGVSFQRLTASNGQELVKFLSSGQIVEMNPNR